jgi:CheY-like chemotaxis protein
MTIFCNKGTALFTEGPRRAVLLALGVLGVWFSVSAGEPQTKAHQPAGSVSDTSAAEMEVAAFGRALTNQLQILQKSHAKADSGHEVVWTVTGVALLGIVLMLKYVPRFLALRDVQVEAQNSALAAADNGSAGMTAEEQSFADFAAKFRVGPLLEPSSPPPREAPPASLPAVFPKPAPVAERIDPIKTFFALVPTRLEAMRKLLENLDETASSQVVFNQLAASTAELKNDSHVPALTPVWQVASALEALANQLGQKARSVTPSTIRTVTAAVDLIEALAKPGLDPALGSAPAIRVLAVDDDPISRHAVAFALKKALNLPDLAANGTSALELADQTAYDAIFLDIQMPGMDGFELCKRLHATERNRDVPVVFITCQNDFEARAKSTDAGGCDLIGKPFLTFEVTLKALTLVLKSRLEKKAPAEVPAIQTEPAPELALAT